MFHVEPLVFIYPFGGVRICLRLLLKDTLVIYLFHVEHSFSNVRDKFPLWISLI